MVLPLMGVSRQPRTVRPSSRAIFSTMPSQMSRSCVSTGRNTMPTPYSPGEGNEKPKLRGFALEKRVGNLDQDARAVAGLRIAPAGAAMRQIDQDLDALQDDVVRLAALDAGDKADAASVMLVLRAVKPLSRRHSSKWI